MIGSRASNGLRAWVTRTKRRWTGLSVQERNAFYLYATSASFGPIQAGIGAYLTVFLVRLGASAQQIGWLSSVPAIVSMILIIPAGFVTERVRDQVRLRTLSSFGMRSVPLLMALAPMLFALSSIPNVAVGLIVLQASALTIAWPAFLTVMTDAVPPQHRSRVNGTRWALMNVVSAVLVPFFGRMLDVVEFPGNYQILFLFSAIGGIGNLYFFSRIKVPPLDVPVREPWRPSDLREGVRSYISSIKGERGFMRFLLGTAAFRLALNMPVPLFSLYWVNELGVSDGVIGLRETAAYTALVVGYLAWGRLSPKIQQRKQLTAGVLLLGIYLIATGLIPGAVWLVPIALIWGLAMSGVNIGLFNVLLSSVPKEKMPRLSGVLNLVGSAAAAVAPLLGVALSQATSIRTALLIIGALTILSIIPLRLVPSDV